MTDVADDLGVAEFFGGGNTANLDEDNNNTLQEESADEANLMLSTRDAALISDFEHTVHRCVACTKNYREIENLGAWTCTQHVAPFVFDTWLCCRSKGLLSAGCVRSHHKHTVGPYDEHDYVFRLSDTLFNYVHSRLSTQTWRQAELGAENALAVHADSYIEIVRYDRANEALVLLWRQKPTRAEVLAWKY